MHKKTAVYTAAEKIEIQDRDKEALKPDEVRLDVAYCGICGTDRHIFHGTMDERVGKKAIIGHEMSGVISETGSNVKDYKKGDRIVVRPLDWCGNCTTCRQGFFNVCENLNFIGVDSEGAFQSSWNVNQRILHRIPEGVSLRDASLVEPLSVAVHDVSRSSIHSDNFAVIIGGGPIGILIAVVLKSKGVKFLLSEVNESRLSVAKSLGFDTVNPLHDDVPAILRERNKGALADVVFEVSASQPGAFSMTQFARPRGKIVIVGIYGKNPEISLKEVFLKELEFFGARVYEEQDFDAALELMKKPDFPADTIISKVYELARIEDAFKELDDDLSVMKILIKCGGLE